MALFQLGQQEDPAAKAEREISEYTEAFNVFDTALGTAGNGTITWEKLGAVIRDHLALIPTEEELKDMIAAVDTTNSGDLEFKKEFLALMGMKESEVNKEVEVLDSDLSKPEIVKLIWSEFDKDKDGLISADELKALITDIEGKRPPDQLIEDMIKLADPSGAKVKKGNRTVPAISKEAFLKMLSDPKLAPSAETDDKKS